MTTSKLKRINLDIPSDLKNEIQEHAKNNGESMITTLIRAWKVYKLAMEGDLYRAHYAEETRLGGEKVRNIIKYTQLEIL